MNKQQLRDLINNLASIHYDFQRELEPDVDEAMQAIDQYAYEYAERVIFGNRPMIERFPAGQPASGDWQGWGAYDLIKEQVGRNKELSSHKEERSVHGS